MILEKNIDLAKVSETSNWRKIAVGTYSVTGDCQVYCSQTINIEPALEFLKNKQQGLTLTHLTGKACGTFVREFPEINRILRFGKFYQRKDVSIFFQVAMDKEGKDLTGHTVRRIDKLGLIEIKDSMANALSKIKSGDDVQYKKAKKQMGLIPSILRKFAINIYGFFLYGLNLWSPLLGAPKDSFGSMMISNIGSLGMQTAFAPLVPYSRCPLILVLGAVYDKVVAIDGEIKIQKSVDCCWTLDHRVIDGVVGAKLAKRFKTLMENPGMLEL